jgi:hypothetical protein
VRELSDVDGARDSIECNSITPSRARVGIAREKITSERRREFGFFSGLRARLHVCIMLARFDPRF